MIEITRRHGNFEIFRNITTRIRRQGSPAEGTEEIRKGEKPRKLVALILQHSKVDDRGDSFS